MMGNVFSYQLSAAFLALCLSLPLSALALREKSTAEKDPQILSGLEEKLRGPSSFPLTPIRADSLSPGLSAGGMEETIWPETTHLAFQNIEPILILQAEGGFGDIAYLRKLLDAFNVRGLTLVVAAVGTPEKQAEALKKFERFTKGALASYTLWREQAGQLVQADGRPVERGRRLRPVLIQHFSQVNPNWSRDIAERLVPELFQPLYEPQGRFLLIGYNAPGNPFGGYLKPEQGEFLNLYQTPPTQPGVHEPNSIYTGNLFDQGLKKLIARIRHLSREERRAAALAELNLPEGLAQAVRSRKGWAYLYTSQGGSQNQLGALIQAFHGSYGTAAFFTFFGKNPRRWYYPDDYWKPHEEIVAYLQGNPRVNFVDLSGIFGSKQRQDAPVWVANLGDVSQESVRLLASASDLILAPGHNTFMDAMGMAAEKVGPKVVLTSQLFRAERKELQEALRSIEASQTLQEIAAFDRLREPGVTATEIDQAAEWLTQLFKSRKRQQRFQRDIGQLAMMAVERSGNPTDGNLGNRILELLIQADRVALDLGRIVESQWPAAAIEAYQRKAAKAFRRTGQEPQLPTAAELEETPVVQSAVVQAEQKLAEDTAEVQFDFKLLHGYAAKLQERIENPSKPEGVGMIEVPELGISAGAFSHKGGRKVQMDRFSMVPLGREGQPPTAFLAIAADGVGGLPGSGRASEEAAEVIPALLQYASLDNPAFVIEWIEKYRDTSDQAKRRSLIRKIRKGMRAAVKMVHEEMAEGLHPPWSTALGLLLLFSDTGLIATVGDVEVNLIRKGKLIRRSQTDRAQGSNKLKQAVGMRSWKKLLVHIAQVRPVLPGDQFGLFTDGVYGPLKRSELRHAMGGPGSPQEKSRALVNLAGSGGDNKTAVVIEVRISPTSPNKSGLEENLPSAPIDQMSPDEVAELSDLLEDQAQSPDVEVSMAARGVHEALKRDTRVRASQALGGIRGIYAPAETPQPTVFLIDHPATWRWAVPIAQTGAPVAVLTDRIARVSGLEELFEAAGISPERYAVISEEAFGGDREAALRMLQKKFGPGVSFQRLPLTFHVEEVEAFLREHGVVFLTDVSAGLEEVEKHLQTLA